MNRSRSNSSTEPPGFVINDSNIHELVNQYFENNLPPALQNVPIGEWDVSLVTDMALLFAVRATFNEPLNRWIVSNVTNMIGMFSGCTSFNQPLDRWNVSNVTNMDGMFSECEDFDQPLNSWEVSNVTNMAGMFYMCQSFNQPLYEWNLERVTNMEFMFYGCLRFDQLLTTWDVGRANHYRAFEFAPMRLENLPSFDGLAVEEVAYEVHNAFDRIRLGELAEIVNYEETDPEINYRTYSDTVIQKLRQMIDSVFFDEEKEMHHKLLNSLVLKIQAIDFHAAPTASFIDAILNYVRRQSPTFQKNYVASFIDQSVFAYGERTDATQEELDGAPNVTTSSCPHGIQERLVMSLRDGGLSISDNREYRQIAAIIGNEAFEDSCPTDFNNSVILQSISTCFKTLSATLDGKDLPEQKRILVECVMEWLRTNHGYASDVPPRSLTRLIDTFDDVLLGSGRRNNKKGHTRCRHKTKRTNQTKKMKNVNKKTNKNNTNKTNKMNTKKRMV